MNLNSLVSRLEADEPVTLRVPPGRLSVLGDRVQRSTGGGERENASPLGSEKARVQQERLLLGESAAIHRLIARPRSDVVRIHHEEPLPVSSGSGWVPFQPAPRDPKSYSIGGGELGSQGVSAVEMRSHAGGGGGVKGRLVAAISEFVDVHVSGAVGGQIRTGVFR